MQLEPATMMTTTRHRQRISIFTQTSPPGPTTNTTHEKVLSKRMWSAPFPSPPARVLERKRKGPDLGHVGWARGEAVESAFGQFKVILSFTLSGVYFLRNKPSCSAFENWRNFKLDPRSGSLTDLGSSVCLRETMLNFHKKAIFDVTVSKTQLLSYLS
jgi:hypothetical protein